MQQYQHTQKHTEKNTKKWEQIGNSPHSIIQKAMKGACNERQLKNNKNKQNNPIPGHRTNHNCRSEEILFHQIF